MRGVLVSSPPRSPPWPLPRALAHPLGNFTTNQATRVDAAGDRIYIVHVVDLAEVPSFPERATALASAGTRTGSRSPSPSGSAVRHGRRAPGVARVLRHRLAAGAGADAPVEVVLSTRPLGPRTADVVRNDPSARDRLAGAGDGAQRARLDAAASLPAAPAASFAPTHEICSASRWTCSRDRDVALGRPRVACLARRRGGRRHPGGFAALVPAKTSVSACC